MCVNASVCVCVCVYTHARPRDNLILAFVWMFVRQYHPNLRSLMSSLTSTCSCQVVRLCFLFKVTSSPSSSSLPFAPSEAAYKSSSGIPILGKPLKLSPDVTSSLCFSLQDRGVRASTPSRSLWVPGQGFTCDTGHLLSEGVSNPSPASLDDFIFCWLLLGPLPKFSVADGPRTSDPKDSSEAG